MAEANSSLHQRQTLDRLFTALDPQSLILSQNHNYLQLTKEVTLHRGPRYQAYADLRESMLLMKKFNQENIDSNLIPQKKQLKYQGALPSRSKGQSVLAQSVPDFSSVVRKENRKPPAAALPPLMEKSATPPAKSSRGYGLPARLAGSKSAGDKMNGGILGARKSYANMDELKGLACAASSAINGENRGMRSRRTVCKTILGYRQY